VKVGWNKMEICKKVAQCIEELWVLDYKGPAFLRNISDKTDWCSLRYGGEQQQYCFYLQ
jgi:hypothetical protein